MQLQKISNADKLALCRRYFLAGFAFLPFMWAVNAVWFFKEAFYVPTYSEQQQIKKYVMISAIGAIVWFTLIITWATLFQAKRSEWGATADYLSFIIPKGVP